MGNATKIVYFGLHFINGMKNLKHINVIHENLISQRRP